MGLYYANLSFVEFRTMILGIHVYVYIGYIQLIKPNIVYKDKTGMTNHMTLYMFRTVFPSIIRSSTVYIQQ